MRIASAAVLLLVALVGGFEAATPAAAPAKPPVDQALRKELLAMAREDQLDATAADAGPSAPGASQGIWPMGRRLVRIKEIVALHGWPGKSLVGEDGAHAAWLLVQHADMEPAFQRFCLDQMQAAFEKGEVTARELSFLTDRVMLAEGKPQMYGTQGAFGSPSPEEEARVNANRAALGLEPWRVFIEERRRHHGGWFPDPK
jgi:hypothetical protein